MGGRGQDVAWRRPVPVSPRPLRPAPGGGLVQRRKTAVVLRRTRDGVSRPRPLPGSRSRGSRLWLLQHGGVAGHQDGGHRQPARAVVPGAVGVLRLGPPGHPAAGPDAGASEPAAASRSTSAVHHRPAALALAPSQHLQLGERRTPPTVGCRTRETEQGLRKTQLGPGRVVGESTHGGCVIKGSARPARRSCVTVTGDAGERRRSSPRVKASVGKAARREAASLLERQTSACRRCGPAVCQTAMPQGMRSRSKRQTCLEQADAL